MLPPIVLGFLLIAVPGDPESLALLDHQGNAWLADITFGVTLQDGRQCWSSDPRYEIVRSEEAETSLLRLADRLGEIDMELSIRRLGERSALLRLRLRNCSRTDLRLDRMTVLSGTLPVRRASSPALGHVLLNGLHSWDNPNITTLSAGRPWCESAWTIAVEEPLLAAGFTTAWRAIGRFKVSAESSRLSFSAWQEGDGCLLAAGASRATDELFLSAEAQPLAQMERFADLAATANGAALWPRNFATWCSWYAGWIRQGMYTYKDGLEAGIEDNVPRIAQLFGARGAACMRIVDDSDDMPYGDWDGVTKAVPRGFSHLVSLMEAQGVTPGFWLPVYMVSNRTRLFREHPDWLARNDRGEVYLQDFYGNTCGVIDTSNPASVQHFEALGRDLRERGFRYVMTDFLVNALSPTRFHDATATKGEMHRRGLEALRRGFGRDVYWLGCGALLGSCMGLADGMRISGDSFGDQPYSYLQSGARWFYHRKLWLNDPDAIVCRGKSVAWNRGWMSWMALAGLVLTYGDTFDDLGAEYVATYQRIFPPLDIAGRPLDLLENDPYLLWGVRLGEKGAGSKLFGLFYFANPAGLEVLLNLDEIAARIDSFDEKPAQASPGYLLWDFWDETLVASAGADLLLPLPRETGRLFALREVCGHPQLLGSSGHFSQGFLEAPDVTWNATAKILTGQVRGNGGEPTALYFHVPDGLRIERAELGGTLVSLREDEPHVLALDVPELATPVPFELVFAGAVSSAPRRAFASGRAATLAVAGEIAADRETIARFQELGRRAPAGYRLEAYVDCGAKVGTGASSRLRLTRGQPWTWEGTKGVAPAAAASVVFDEERIVFEVTGLDPHRSYQLAFTWWDYDSNGRVQSVHLAPEHGSDRLTLIARARLPAWSRHRELPESHLFLVPQALSATGHFTVIITNDAKAPNAVVSELWLWESEE
ncbi:MAG: alpha-galactosidase [Planctomycetota bacterium]